ncbi:MAG: DNA polymerase III subunit gamma/tau [Gemmataceae bacterium]|nr:DNA polymerase III subunit gamma/tau [Gemmataceae bacterium]
MARKKTAEVVETPSVADAALAVGDASAEYTVLARRYRPQQFADLAGQEPVAQALTNALKSNRVAHAYLFTGARGVGKTSAARILAKALNCDNGPTSTPCDQCPNCKAIAVGEDIDVLEIDGASNRGIDEIRDLRANVQYRPQRSRYKVYIIDEVHMLTTQAFNALLKTLEEPPPHVKFIFATTEANKIPITILSRCQRFDFAGIGMSQLRERLKQIVSSEGMAADDEAIDLVARRAGGSMRDAQSLLDQLLSFGGDRLTAERVHQLLGTAHEDRVVELAAALIAKDAAKALEALEQSVERGQQLGELLDQLIEYWRDLMIVQAAGPDVPTLSVTGAHRGELQKQAKAWSPDAILAGLDILVSAKSRMRFTSHPRVILEMALVRMARLENLAALSQLVQWVQEGQVAGPRSAASAPASGRQTPGGSTTSAEKKKLTDDSPARVQTIDFTEENLPQIWQQVLLQGGLMLASDIKRAAGYAIFGPNSLVVRFAAKYNHANSELLEPARRAALEGILTRIVGKPIQVRTEAISDTAVNGGTSSASDLPVNRTRKMRTEIMQFPLLQKASQQMGAQIVAMDDDFGTAARRSEPVGVAADEADDTGEVLTEDE